MEYEHSHQAVHVGLAISHEDDEGNRLSQFIGCPCISEAEAMQLLEDVLAQIRAEGQTHDAATQGDA